MITFDITKDISSLTEFKRNTLEALKQLRVSRRPLVLTVNGRAEVVVQDAASYQSLVDELERFRRAIPRDRQS